MKTLHSLTLCVLLAAPAFAVDGVILINQANALAGNVTPGDTPGFPVTISQPGSYRLSSNLIVSDPNAGAIVITADHVTIDLNGFSIIGPAPCSSCSSPLASGVFSSNKGITILNGGIYNMPAFGIELAADAHVSGIIAEQNGAGGIVANQGVFTNNVANSNTSIGIGVNGPAVVSGNTAIGNSDIGILAAGGVITNNVASFNGSYGIFTQELSTVVSGNNATRNGTANLFVFCPASITNNAASLTFNGGSGCVTANNSN